MSLHYIYKNKNIYISKCSDAINFISNRTYHKLTSYSQSESVAYHTWKKNVEQRYLSADDALLEFRDQ